MSSWPDDIDLDPGIFFDSVFDQPFNNNYISSIPDEGTPSIFDPGPSLDFSQPMPFGEILGSQGYPPGYSSSLSDNFFYASPCSITPHEAMENEIYELARGIEDSSLITSYRAQPDEYITTAPLSPTRGPGSMV
ncbi:hypothetical protein V2G26_008967 [Clonostachys chloroleuca]